MAQKLHVMLLLAYGYLALPFIFIHFHRHGMCARFGIQSNGILLPYDDRVHPTARHALDGYGIKTSNKDHIIILFVHDYLTREGSPDFKTIQVELLRIRPENHAGPGHEISRCIHIQMLEKQYS